MYRIGKRFTFDAAHDLPAGQPQARCRPGLHGHTYTVEVVVVAHRLTGPGFVVDYAALDPFGRYLDEHLDHRLLNDVLDAEPTHDALRRHLHTRFEADSRLPADRVTLRTVRVDAPALRLATGSLADHEVTFEAAHRLPDLPTGHQCGRVHGHSYLAGLGLASTTRLPPASAAALAAYVDEAFDGRYLNDSVPAAGAPTAENLARHLYEWSVTNLAVPPPVAILNARISETPTTWAEYRESPQ